MLDRNRIQSWLGLSKKAYPFAEELLSNEIFVFVSAIAMNALLAFFPFVILLVSIATRFLPDWNIHTMTFQILEQYLPSNQDFIVRNVRELSLRFGRVQFVSLIVLIWSVANVFIPLEMALNRAWGVKESRGFWRSQSIAVLISATSGALALVFIAGAALTQDTFIQVIPASWALTQSALKFINIKLWMVPLTLLLFFVTFYLLPNTRISWRQVLPAAVFTGLLWETSNYILMGVLPYLGLSTIYGAFVVTVTLLTWAYVSGIILVLGANLTARNALSPVIVGRLASLSHRPQETAIPVQDQPTKPDTLTPQK